PREEMRFGMQRFRDLVGLAALVVLTVAAGVAAAGTQHRTAKPVLRIGLIQVISTNPAKSADFMVVDLAYAPIIAFAQDGIHTTTKGLATSWPYVATGNGANKGFEFTLRHNARYSDGTPVTAKSVANWLNYFAKANGFYATYFGPNPKFTAVGK